MTLAQTIEKSIPAHHQWRKENSIDAIGNNNGWIISASLRKLLIINLSIETSLQTIWSLWYEFHKDLCGGTITADIITSMYDADTVQDTDLLVSFLDYVNTHIYLIPQFTYHTINEWSEEMKNLYSNIFNVQEELIQMNVDVPTSYIDAFMSINPNLTIEDTNI